MGRTLFVALLLGLLAGSASLPASAQSLTIGEGTEITSVDPLYHLTGANTALSREIFDAVVLQDPMQRPQAGLAGAWRFLDDTHWVFTLRPGVRFHDGSALTAEDVIFSIDRAAKVPNSPSSLGRYTASIAAMTAPDPMTVSITTKETDPLLPLDLSNIGIQSKRVAAGKTTEDFNHGSAAIGTGPYKFVEWVPGSRLVLERNDAYWGPKPDWARVTIRPIGNAASRTAALLAGDVDVIDDVASADLARLKADPRITVVQGVSSRLLYLDVNLAHDQSPYVTDKEGKPLDRNPFKDLRVRKALSEAIDRATLCDKVLQGAGEPAGQLSPAGTFGDSAKLGVEPYDPAGARRLLDEAGYGAGFGVMMLIPNGVYADDQRVGEALAQMLSRIGIEVRLAPAPANLYTGQRNKGEFGILLSGFFPDTGEASSNLRGLLATWDPAKGMGSANRGRYTNPKLDGLLEGALGTMADDRRAALLAEATEVGIEDVGLIPLYYQSSSWALRRGLTIVPNRLPITLPSDIHKLASQP